MSLKAKPNGTADCPHCEQEHPVKERWMQATRKEARRYLGLTIYCPAAQLEYPVQL